MEFFRKASIQRKQTLIILLTSGAALLLACAAIATYEIAVFRTAMVGNLSTLAEIIGNNSTAGLDFNDARAVEETLSALKAEPSIIGASVYTRDGNVFAVFDRPNDNIKFRPPAKTSNGYEFNGRALVMFQPIVSKGETIGTVYVESDLNVLYSRLQQYVIIVLAVFCAATFVAFLISARLQRVISTPILQLVAISRKVAHEGNYSVRAVKQSEDELGTLVDGFNAMLAQIESREAELQKSNATLEQRVQERTGELANSLSLLNATLQSTTDGLLVINSEGNVTNFNEQFVKHWALPADVVQAKDREQMVGYVLPLLKNPDAFVATLREMATRPDENSFDLLELKDGRVFERYSKPQRIGDKTVGRVWSIRDVTERKKADETLRRTEELYRRAIAGADAVPYAYDYETRSYLFMGEGIKQLIGYEPSEVTHEIWERIIQESIMGGETAGLDKAEAARRIKRGELRTWRCDMRVVSRDGKIRWLSDASVQSLNDTGKPIGSMGILQDITERKLAEEHLKQRSRLAALGGEIGVALTRPENLREILAQCATALVRHVDAAFARIWSLSEHDDVLELQASAGMYTRLDGTHSRLQIGKSKIGLIAEERKAYLTNSVIGDRRIADQDWAKREGLIAFAGFPLIVNGKVVGVMALFAKHQLAPDTLQKLATIADAIALGIMRKQAEEEREKLFALVENSTDFIGMVSLSGTPIYLNPAGAKLVGLPPETNVASTQAQDFYDRATWSMIHDVVYPAVFKTGSWEGEVRLRHLQTGELVDVHRHTFMVRHPQSGEPLCIATVHRDITERKRAEESLRLHSSAISQSADNIVITERNGKIRYVNPAFLQLTGYTEDEVIGMTPRMVKSDQHTNEFYHKLWATILSGDTFRADFINRKKSGDLFIEEKTITPVTDSNGTITHFVATGRDITQRKRTEEELQLANKQLVETSRRAGMAEVASSVLHNVGNVLNSVNVSAAVLGDRIRGSRISSLVKAMALLRQHTDDIGKFLSEDPKGRQLPNFLFGVVEYLTTEQKALLKELDSLGKNIEHIKDIVAMQQSYAKVSGVSETIAPVELIEDALRMNEAAFTRHQVQLVREFADVPPINVEKHKVLQILVNLMRNAKYAVEECGTDKPIRIRLERKNEDCIGISVIDDGVGIPPENLTRIFNHGFTTRKDGHGFGLHSGALAAKELGGSLTAHSDGPGQGATFTLELPLGNSTQPQPTRVKTEVH